MEMTESLVTSLSDSDFSPNQEQKFGEQRPDERTVYLIRIDVEGDEHKNSGEFLIEKAFNGIILERVKQSSIPLLTKLKRDFFSRIWELFIIYFGTASTAIPTLITTADDEISFHVPQDIHWIFVAALVPTIFWYIAGLRKLGEKYGSVKKKF